MSSIVSFPPGPPRPGSAGDPRPALPPVQCTDWCADATGHGNAVHIAEQSCLGYAHRVDASNGGGTFEDQAVTSFASVIIQAERQSGEQATFLLGIELGDSDAFVRLTRAELATLVKYARLALDDTKTA